MILLLFQNVFGSVMHFWFDSYEYIGCFPSGGRAVFPGDSRFFPVQYPANMSNVLGSVCECVLLYLNAKEQFLPVAYFWSKCNPSMEVYRNIYAQSQRNVEAFLILPTGCDYQ